MAETPFGQLPVLEIDGEALPTTFAIARYLARKFGGFGRAGTSLIQVVKICRVCVACETYPTTESKILLTAVQRVKKDGK